MRPHSCKPRKKILILSEFYLCLCIRRLCPLGEYVQNEVRPVENLDVQFALYVPQLGGGELIVEYGDVNFILLYECLDFFKFAASDVCSRIRLIDLLYESSASLHARRFGQKFEFVEVFVHHSLFVSLLQHSDEHCLLDIFLDNYGF